MSEEHNEQRSMNARTTLDRREFLKLLGGGVVVTFSIGDVFAQRGRREYPEDFNAYLRIGEDGRVACFTGKIEMGQGIITSLAQMLAEELRMPLDTVDMVMGDTQLCPWDAGTFGSRSTKYFGPPLRRAAAEARHVLLELAAERLAVPQNRLMVQDGVVVDTQDARTHISYADLTQGKVISRHIEAEPTLRPHEEHTVSGQPIRRSDALEKVTGEAVYAGDIRLPGMRYARLLRPPAHGARLVDVDTSAAEGMPDVEVVRDGDLVAVLHPTPDGAAEALARLEAQFDVPEPTVDNASIHAHLLDVAPEASVVTQQGDLETGRQLASTAFEESYRTPYVAHAPIEPHTATAQVEGNKATVWASTQRPFGARDEVARALDIPTENVRVITPFVGGGFGGKTRNQQAVEAARLAKLAGKPVQVAWTREEEFFHDTFQPAAVIKIRSGLDDDHRITFWDYGIYFAGDRSSQPFYAIPHHLVSSRGGWRARNAHPFPTGAWRGPGSNTNNFARESHMDVMAAKAGIDPLEFRLRNLQNPRMQHVLETVADRFGWTPARTPSGRGVGLACLDYLGTYVAGIAEVAVDKATGAIEVKRIVCAQDMGEVINPLGAKMQMEGGITMGLGYALSEEVRFAGGEVRDLNFGTYRITRFSWTPVIETVLIDNPDHPPQGGGEPAITCVGGMLANAVHDAIGVRLYQLPMTPARIREAIG